MGKEQKKSEKAKKLMDFTGITASLEQDFNIIRYPFGAVFELLDLDVVNRKNAINAYAEEYAGLFSEEELDEALCFFEGSAGKKILDHSLKILAAGAIKKILDEKMNDLGNKFITVMPEHALLQ